MPGTSASQSSTCTDNRAPVLARALAVVVPVAFLVLGIVRAYPFIDDVQLPAPHPDDWHTYKQLAVSVVDGGLSIPGLASTYTRQPHGFLYIYFLALVFRVMGRINSTHVYVVQSFIAGLSVSLTYEAVRRHLTARGGVVFMLALAVLMYVDVFRHLSFKLLSENLYFLVSPLLFICLFRSVDDPRHQARDSFLAGAALGLVVLARSSFTGSALLIIAVLLTAAAVQRRGIAPIVWLGAGLALAISGVAIRDYAATGHASLDLLTDPSDWVPVWKWPLGDVAAWIAARTMFVLGYTRSIAPGYRMRPYWTVLWLLWAAYPARRIRSGRTVELWEWLAYAFVVGYIVPVVLVAGDIGSYGGRMIIVVLPLLLVSAFRLFCAADERLPALSVSG